MCELRQPFLQGKRPLDHDASKLVKKKVCWPGKYTNDPKDCIYQDDGAEKQGCVKQIGSPDNIIHGREGILMEVHAGQLSERVDCFVRNEIEKEAKKKNEPRETSAAKRERIQRAKKYRESPSKAEREKERRKREARKDGYEDIDVDEAEGELRGGSDEEPMEGYPYEEQSGEEDEMPETSTTAMFKGIVKQGVDSMFGK